MASVLVVDDSPYMRKLVRDALEGDGHSIVGEASSVEEFDVLAAAFTPDLLMLDLFLPEGDAMNALRRFSEASPKARVVAYAEIWQEREGIDALEAGAHVLTKPLTPTRVCDAARIAIA
jgi:two-component system chemotaxis response regulator CheY